ncbi:MAG TPA: nickel ABC transporter permease [Candidatus Eisenbacteria bacterium]|nr:nickel ABC transporter permease [Candidatus Eisenbacteria bacterium]
MKRYVAERFLLLLPTLLGAVTVVFVLIHLVPGDPVDVMLGESASASDREALRRHLGLDRPLLVQYREFLAGLAVGDLGRSLYERRSVAGLIAARLPATVELAISAVALAVLVAFPLAVLAAAKNGSWFDRMALFFSLLGVSMPNFWLGPLLMILFSIQLGWLPVSGRGGPEHLLLPAVTLGMGMAAILVRMLRASLLRIKREDYVQTARAKGLSETRVWLKHILRNASISVITILGLQLGGLLAGSIIAETIFAWPGVGRLTVQAIQTRDYPLVQGCVLVIAIAYVVINFLTDVIYRFVDPRISYEN